MNFRDYFSKGVLVVLLGTLLTACATSPKPTKTSHKSGERHDAVSRYLHEEEGTKEPILASTVADETREPNASDIENYTIDKVIRVEEPNTANLYDNSRYDFPITMNSRVEGWIDYFTGRGREHMERYLARSSRYIPIMKQILKKMALPEDLVYLALIESGFNLQARSHARAVGPWQFMKATGKRYGLRVDSWVDERRDPLRSTEAAGKFLKDLYLMFESWYLAASAYNAGEFKILRAIEALKTNNFWRISETRHLRRETKDYIPKLIAAAIIAKNAARYGFGEVTYQEPLEFETVSIDFPVRLADIAKIVDSPAEDIEELNPHLIHGIVPPDGEAYPVRVPVGTRVLVESAIAGLKTKLVSSALPLQHQVKRGETLASVSKKYHVKVRELANANNLSPREKLSPGANLVIPKKMESLGRITVKRTVSSTPPIKAEGGYIVYRVHEGESLWSISQKYNVTVDEIFKWNKLKSPRIHPGKQLRIRPQPSETATDSLNTFGEKNKNA